MTNTKLTNKLGNIALLNGRFNNEVDGSLLNDFIKEIPVTISISQTYYDHSKLIELAENNIETILISEPFAFQDKIFDIYEEIVRISKETGWKPKRLINTMEYGKEGLFLMCEKVGIEFYQLNYNYNRETIGTEDFDLEKINITGRELDIAKIKNNHLFF